MRLKVFCMISVATLGLAGCESSSRFGGFGNERVSSRPISNAPEPIIAAPTPQVDSAPLSAPGGVATAPLPGSPQDPNSLGQTDPTALPPVTPPRPTPPPRIAAVTPAPDPNAAPTRSSVTGNWSLAEAAGGKCKATLSSAPALDLYKASTSGCNSKDIQRVTAWELRGTEIYLYEAGGGVAARLQQSGSNTYNGATAKSGAPITLSK